MPQDGRTYRFGVIDATYDAGEDAFTVAGDPAEEFRPNEHDPWKGRCHRCGRIVTLYCASAPDGTPSYSDALWACDCGETGLDDIGKCGACGMQWGDSATGERDSTKCGYCSGDFLWEPCPACGGEGGFELRYVEGTNPERYRCMGCGGEYGVDEDGYPVTGGDGEVPDLAETPGPE